jgi:glycosyltransferase involved in cell wall biosynthesis
MNTDRPLKVLACAFNFSPVKGSEFAIGWDYVRAIAARHKVWVITRGNERDETEEYLRQHPDVMPNLVVHYIPWINMKWDFPFWEVLYSFLWRKWQQRAYQLARDLGAQIDFDLIHHVTGTGFREPGFLWKMGKPFVWGPVGGMQYFPLRLLGAVPLLSRPFFIAKNCANFWSMHVSRRPRLAAARAKLIIAGTSEVSGRIRSLWGREAPILCEVNSPECKSEPPARRLPGERFRIVWSGSFQPRKALNIVLLALERLKATPIDWELLCLGGGPLEKRWKALARDCGIADRCRFLGRLPRAEALEVMVRGHCFVQPSLYDATSSVVVEALAMGLPVVCLDHFGFRDVIDDRCGIRIAPRSYRQVVADFAGALQTLAQNEDLRHGMAIGAQKASVNLTWNYKASVLADLYRCMLAGNSISRSCQGAPI